MSIIIQKFGGTSLRNLSKKSEFLKHVNREIDLGNKLIVVVSAMGRNGDPYATDTFINLLENINTVINPKKKDLIMSVGETISAAMVSHLLESEGFPSEALMGFQAGIITDDTFNSSEIIDINTNRIHQCLNENKIVVVAGFQGATNNMELTTLGRGGSDTTAVALGGYLGAERVDIFTDVPGVAITDPRIVPNAKYFKKITYDHMYNLAINGATVIHPKAVLLGKQYNIPIRILSTFIDGPGTLINSENSDLQVIGFGIKKYKDNSIISLIFNSNCNAIIKKELDNFLKNEKEHILDVEYYNDKVSLRIRTELLNEFTQRLYSKLIQ